jgi:hypothetical protein
MFSAAARLALPDEELVGLLSAMAKLGYVGHPLVPQASACPVKNIQSRL